MGLTDAMLSDNRILSALDTLAKELTPDEIAMLKQLLKVNRGQELDVLLDLIGYTYEERPVGMREFIESPEYLNMEGQVFPVIMDDLEELFSGEYDEAILTGGIGWGKSTFAEIALVRMVYEVLCLRDPQKVYGLAKGTSIAFVNVSVSKEQAKKVVFHGIKTKLKNSYFFTHRFPYDAELSEEMRFPKNVWIAPVVNPIGYNVFGGVLDEVNFMGLVERSAMARGGRYDQAQVLHDNIIRRMRSRFMIRGKLPGILLSISSARYPDDFTERMIEKAKDDPKIFVRRYSQWDTKPSHYFIGEKFLLSLGNSSKDAEILKDDEQGTAEEKRKILEAQGIRVIEVPIEYIKDFETDLDGSIRDLAGMPTLTIHPFILNRSKIFDAIARADEAGFAHPYSKESTTLQDGGHFIRNLLKPDSKPRFVHIDLALKGDAAGFCMGHVRGWRKVQRRDLDGNIYEEVAPEIGIDLMLRIVAPDGGEIQIADVRALVYELQSYGYKIQVVTFDQFQSAESMQQLRRRGIHSEHLSVDINPMPYQALKEALNEDRIWMYDYQPVIEELIRLEKNEKTGRVDHPINGSKDVSDALAGVCYHCSVQKPNSNVPPILGEVVDKYGRSSDDQTDEDQEFIDPMFAEVEDFW